MWFTDHDLSKHSTDGSTEDAGVIIGIFALGVVLITAFAGQVDLDQECVLYGEIAYVPWDILDFGDFFEAVWI